MLDVLRVRFALKSPPNITLLQPLCSIVDLMSDKTLPYSSEFTLSYGISQDNYTFITRTSRSPMDIRMARIYYCKKESDVLLGEGFYDQE